MAPLDYPAIPRQRTDADLDRLRATYADRWDILRTTDRWHAVRRDPRPPLQGLSAHTARGLWRDLARVEEATR